MKLVRLIKMCLNETYNKVCIGKHLSDIKIGNRSFENVSQFKYLGTTVTNQNLIQQEIKRRLNSGNACYHSVQKLLSSSLLSKNIKFKIYRTIIFGVEHHLSQ
jgi:hypothetical protein